MVFSSLDQLLNGVQEALKVSGDSVEVLDREKLRGAPIDHLIYSAVFSPEPKVREYARWLIRKAGAASGIFSASIYDLYMAMGRNEMGGFTVPAINIRGLTYASAQAVYRAVLRGNVGAFIFEIARSEIGYTEQRPAEYTAAVLAAAIKTGYSGPVFLQGDHFQISAKKFAVDPVKEVEAVRELIVEAVRGGFYNIDIDSSTVVDLSKTSIAEQQENNYIAAELSAAIRKVEPKGLTVSIGGEIGEVGKKNSTAEELRAFMNGYRKELEARKGESAGIRRNQYPDGNDPRRRAAAGREGCRCET